MSSTVTPFDQRIRITALRLYFLLAIPLIVFSKSAWSETHWLFELLEVAGVFLIISGVLGRFWAILYIGGQKNRSVVQDGPYSICRHPLYLFSTIGVLGFGLMLGSIVLTLFLAGSVFAILSMTAAREEQYLRATFGAEYDAYARRVPRILPRPSLFSGPEFVTFSVPTLSRNLSDALVFLALIPLAELAEGLHEMSGLPHFLIW